jgi:tetratricopeptide (TPR) repeat protein
MEDFYKNSDIILKFYSLSNHSKVRYYEDYIQKNFDLTIDEKIELEIEYIFALFQLGKYDKVLANIDTVIEKVIFENIEKHNGHDAYLGLLFKKAACYHNLGKFDQCIALCRQLIKIDSTVPIYSHLLHLAQKKKKHVEGSLINFIGIGCMMIGMLLYVLDIFVIDPFYNEYHIDFIRGYQAFLTLGFVRVLFHAISYIIKKYA